MFPVPYGLKTIPLARQRYLWLAYARPSSTWRLLLTATLRLAFLSFRLRQAFLCLSAAIRVNDGGPFLHGFSTSATSPPSNFVSISFFKFS